jgi:hypothetical protein
MTISHYLKTVPIITAIILTPAFALADVQYCAGQAPVGPGDYSQEASRLLDDMHADAYQIAHHASVLQGYATDPDVDWEMHADQLYTLKNEVNNMGKQLCRLESIQSVLPRDEQHPRTIEQVAPLVQYLADNTTDAINFVNAHQGDFWNPVYQKYALNINDGASSISHDIHQVQRRDDYLTTQSQTYSEEDLGSK